MTDAQTSLIIASYNQPNAMRLVLEGVLTQTYQVDEILIADDGSQDDTRQLIDEFAKRLPAPVLFTTQEDRGFRKALALNNAIRRSTGDKILFLDGDCIPPPGWAQRHVDALESADLAVAGYIWMTVERARAVTVEQVAAGRIDELITADERARFRRVHRREVLYRILRRPKKPRILGGNWSVRRAALFAVNGFDERFDGFGKEDSDVRNRLRNAGFRGRSLWGSNWVYHCSHDLDPRRNLPNVMRGAPNRNYYDSRVRAKDCEMGLVERSAG